VSDEDRKRARSIIRKALAPYREGRFETGESGGASGMMFFRDRDNKQWFLGGLNRDEAKRVVDVLNATLDLLETGSRQ